MNNIDSRQKVFDNAVDKLIKQIPDNLDDIEKARYVYLNLGKLLSYDEKYWYGNSEIKNRIYKKSMCTTPRFSEIQPNKKKKAICVSISKLYSSVLNKVGINAGQQHEIDHTFTYMFANNKLYYADLNNDLKFIQLNLPTRYFFVRGANFLSKDILQSIDEKLGYTYTGQKSFEDTISLIKSKTQSMNKLSDKMQCIFDLGSTIPGVKDLELIERNSTYKPILQELKNYFSNRTKEEFKEGINVLVPGAGLGRLMYEIAKLGFKSQGNEFSYYMLLCSNFIFNNTTKKDEFILQPLIHSFSNIFNEETPFKKILIPDENLAEELSKTDTGEMSMVAGEFCRVYKDKINFFDSIVTCYFIDTANNIIEYIETIHNIIKIGGLWINFGPLLYHYTENESEVSIELSWEEVKHIILGFGFEFKKIEKVKTTYSSNKESMTQRIYNCIYFTAVKMK